MNGRGAVHCHSGYRAICYEFNKIHYSLFYYSLFYYFDAFKVTDFNTAIKLDETLYRNVFIA